MDPMEYRDAGEVLRQIDSTLSEIERTLDQMLALAELSAGEGDIERANLQKVLEHLRRKIDHIADRLDEI